MFKIKRGKKIIFSNISKKFFLPPFILFYLFASCFLAGCTSESIDNYRHDAAAFCELFKAEHWQAYANKPGSIDLKKELESRINKTIKTRKFKQVVTELDDVKFLRNLYPTARQKISALTGEEWNCPDYSRFYGISFEKEPDVPGPQISPIEIKIDTKGNISVTSVALARFEPDSLRKAILNVATTKPPKVIVKKSRQTPDSVLKKVLATLYKMGIRKLQIYEE